MSSLSVSKRGIAPSPSQALVDAFTRAAIQQAAETLERAGYFNSVPPGPAVTLPDLEIPTGIYLDEIEADPVRTGKRAGYALAAKVVVSGARSAPPPPTTAAPGPKTCPTCGKKTAAAAPRCYHCGVAFAVAAAGPRGGVGRAAVLAATFETPGDAHEKGLAAQEIDRQFAQAVLEEKKIASRISVLFLGTAVRAPRSDMEFGIAIEGGAKDVSFAVVVDALAAVGFEPHLAQVCGQALLDLDAVLAHAKSGAMNGTIVTKFIKADVLAGASSAAPKLRAIKQAIVANPRYKQWIGVEIQTLAKRAAAAPRGPLGLHFLLKDSPGAIRDIQHLSWLSAFCSGEAPGYVEAFDGLVAAGLITREEAQSVKAALLFFREVRRRQHLALGREEDTFAPPAFGDQADKVAHAGGVHAANVRAILIKVAKGS